MNLNIWNINYDNLLTNKIKNFILENSQLNKTYILNTKNTQFSIIEKYVYDIAKFHFNNLNLDINNNFVEFWFKQTINKNNGINEFHVDCDEYKKKTNFCYEHPLLSCVTYFNNSEYPLLLTEIDVNSYKYKNFKNKNNIAIIFPEENKQVTFNGSFYHGVVNVFKNTIKEDKRIMLAINLWDKKPENVSIYNESNVIETNITNNTEILHITNNNSNLKIKNIDCTFNYSFYNNMLYNSKNFELNENIITNILDLYKLDNYSFILSDNKLTNKNTLLELSNKELLKLHIELTSNLNNTDEIVKNNIYNRFLQRYVINNIYSKNVCEWIISEAESYAQNNGGWTTKRHMLYPTTDLPVINIKNIVNFVFFSFNDIFNKIKQLYNLNKDDSFNITDIFIVKYEEGLQNFLELHTDGSFITINILLSDKNNFEGGGTYFDDGTTYFLNQGDMLIHSGLIKHSGLPIIKGKRYLLVAFTNIITSL